jgi:hypothetical protein
MSYRVQVDDVVRDATPEEVAMLEAQRVEAERVKAELQARVDARVSALAKLAALGLDEAEIKALLG